MTVNPHLVFSGQCEEAFKFYERCLDAEIGFILTWGDSPLANQVPAEWGGKVLHATLLVGDTVLTGVDVVPEEYDPPRGFSVTLGLDDPVAAERIFGALAENGTVGMPLQETFWAARFGGVVDRFGIPWEINCEEAT